MFTIPAWTWLLGGLFLLVAELLTPTFYLGIIGVGALVGGLFDLLPGSNDLISFIGFLAGTGGAAYLARKFSIYSSDREFKSGVDKFIGEEARVKRPIVPGEEEGVVRVQGEDWRARSKYGDRIESGTRVVVEEIEGTTMIVWPMESSKEIENSEEG